MAVLIKEEGDIKGEEGNFIKTNNNNIPVENENILAPNRNKNGEKDYSKARQDIYIEGYDGTEDAATSIVITGNLTGEPGSIWVWAENANHYKTLTQFATVQAGVTLTDASYKVFRNARSDADTECGGDYLTGQKGEVATYVYWTGGFDLVFQKIDGYGNPLAGATFTLFKANNEKTGILKDAQGQDTVYLTAEEKEVYGNGLVTFEKVSPGTYFLKETTAPKVTAESDKTWIAAEEMYKVVMNGNGTYSVYVERKEGNSTVWTQKAPTTLFVGEVDGTDIKYTNPPQNAVITAEAETIDIYTALNISPYNREVILRKVNNEKESLEGAKFTVYYADKQTVVKATRNKLDGEGNVVDDGNGNPVKETYLLENLESGAAGAFWIGDPPYGTYYVKETQPPTTPSGYSAPDEGYFFVLTVKENGVGYLSTENSIVNSIEPTKAAY